jgi:hypothetical protein
VKSFVNSSAPKASLSPDSGRLRRSTIGGERTLASSKANLPNTLDGQQAAAPSENTFVDLVEKDIIEMFGLSKSPNQSGEHDVLDRPFHNFGSYHQASSTVVRTSTHGQILHHPLDNTSQSGRVVAVKEASFRVKSTGEDYQSKSAQKKRVSRSPFSPLPERTFLGVLKAILAKIFKRKSLSSLRENRLYRSERYNRSGLDRFISNLARQLALMRRRVSRSLILSLFQLPSRRARRKRLEMERRRKRLARKSACTSTPNRKSLPLV